VGAIPRSCCAIALVSERRARPEDRYVDGQQNRWLALKAQVDKDLAT
jgi:hypothetical protein